MIGKFESNKDLIQELTSQGARHVGNIATIITGTVAEVTKEIGDWAKERFLELKVDGIYIIITKEPKKFHTFVGKKTIDGKLFTKANQEAMIESLKGLAKDRNGVLLKVAREALEAMDRNTKKVEPAKKQARVSQRVCVWTW